MDWKITLLKKSGLFIFLVVSIVFSFSTLISRQERSVVIIMLVILGLLIFFTILARLLQAKKISMADEITVRTKTWWWMIAILMLAMSVDRLISFIFLSFTCFLALKEYFSLSFGSQNSTNRFDRDRWVMYFCYLAIIINTYYAYIKWYATYIITIPVYTFLLIPIIFVLQNRTKDAIKSLGLFSVGIMFFAFNLGHSLFMINLGPMILLYCFSLTEFRDLLAFWIGKCLQKFTPKNHDTLLYKLLNLKIAPEVNPRKTWITGLSTALVISFVSLLFVPLMPPFPAGTMSYFFAWEMGLLIGSLGLMGDLVFSMIKRDLGIKDSGDILPGHGGVIDRVNSLVFTIPITFHMFNWLYF
ncbi:hypothetical protein A2159_02130 [Candidatus Woesebacteria bacterium RBG_13_34_9]|uniref:Phosphatidate cytidylyltransferase n=1 Tax=Candidatus Woesebacteria bacterium RBG_13_34_9 TaxID=1802477 RepID=A0A1F7X596_9BACT|nr:MAG: hypothetical protein A2159_02130 [Candidatus Woesebacteria bacterium RBG_13_34_9]